jgi:hypothetical protein
MAGSVCFRIILANFVPPGSPVRSLLLDGLVSLACSRSESWLGTQDSRNPGKILAYIHALSGIRNHDLSIQEGDDTAFLAPHGLGFAPRLPGFDRSSSCGVNDGQSGAGEGFLLVFMFPYQFSFHRLLHIHHHLSSGAGAVGTLATVSPPPPFPLETYRKPAPSLIGRSQLQTVTLVHNLATCGGTRHRCRTVGRLVIPGFRSPRDP